MAFLLNDGRYIMIKDVSPYGVTYYDRASKALRDEAGSDTSKYPRPLNHIKPVNFNIPLIEGETLKDAMLRAGYNVLKDATGVQQTVIPLFPSYEVVPGE